MKIIFLLLSALLWRRVSSEGREDAYKNVYFYKSEIERTGMIMKVGFILWEAVLFF